MKTSRTIAVAILLIACTCHLTKAEDSDLRGLLEIASYGRLVAVVINGVELPVEGGRVEVLQLFHRDHPSKSDFPENRRSQLCLQTGTNTIYITHTQKTGEAPRSMDVTLSTLSETADGKLKPSGSPIFARAIPDTESTGTISAVFMIGDQPVGE